MTDRNDNAVVEDQRPAGLGLHRQLIQRMAADLAERLTRRVIRSLQSLAPGVLADEGVANLWEEICVQTRRESFLDKLYVEELAGRLNVLVGELSNIERLVLWLQTDNGEMWVEDNSNAGFETALLAVSDRDSVNHVMKEHVDYECWNYENKRIRDFTGE
jgi:hypothetical protein